MIAIYYNNNNNVMDRIFILTVYPIRQNKRIANKTNNNIIITINCNKNYMTDRKIHFYCISY